MTASPEEEGLEEQEEQAEEELHLQPTNQVVQMCQGCQVRAGQNTSSFCSSRLDSLN